jgi:hypothetical protein
MVECFWLVRAAMGGSPLMILQKMQGAAIVCFLLSFRRVDWESQSLETLVG